MAYKLKYLSTAHDDLESIAWYILEKSGYIEAAENFQAKLKKKCTELAKNKFHMGKQRDNLRAGMRSLPIGNYVIFFRYTDDSVEIINILEGHRDIDGFYEEEE